MEIHAKDLYFLSRALKEPARQLTQAAKLEGSPILQKSACPNRQAEVLKGNPHGPLSFSANSCSPSLPADRENVESNCVEPNRSRSFG
jgi:hypothetical protein